MPLKVGNGPDTSWEMSREATKPSARRPSAWGWLVTVSACLVGGGILLAAAGWALTTERRIASYAVSGPVTAVTFDLGAADADIIGGADGEPVRVRRVERFAFGHGPVIRRDASGGELRVWQRCPEAVLGACSADYRIEVPPNAQVTVRTTTGDVNMRGYRGRAAIDTASGDIDVDAYCGFSLRASAASGDVAATATCQTDDLELRSRTGDVRAVVPPGRYEIDADSDAGDRRVVGLTQVEGASFRVQALSSTGDVIVEAGS